MDGTKLMKDQPNPENIAVINKLINMQLPLISLPNQDGNMLQLKRNDSFRLVIYFYSMTGHPNKKLPTKWDQIPGAQGCTLENCLFRDNYEKMIQLNALPLGISTQSVVDIKEMTSRLGIQYDVLSDSELICVNKLSLPTFKVDNQVFIKKMTIIVEKKIIRQVFYPVVSLNKHVDDILKWLKKY